MKYKKLTTKELKFNYYYKHSLKFEKELNKILKEIRDKINKVSLLEHFNFKLYEAFYRSFNISDISEDNEGKIFYNFCDVYYEAFQEEVHGLDVDIKQYGRTSSHYIEIPSYTSFFKTEGAETSGLITMNARELLNYYGYSPFELIDEIEHINCNLKDPIEYKTIYNRYIDNQVYAFLEYIESEKQYELECLEDEEITKDEIIEAFKDILTTKHIFLSDEEIKNHVIKTLGAAEV